MRLFSGLGVVAAACLLALAGERAQAQQYWKIDGTAGIITDATYGSTAAGPFTNTFQNGVEIDYTADSLVTGATTTIGDIVVSNGFTVTFTAGGTLATGGVVRTLNVGTGSILDLGGQNLSTAAGTGFTKSGAGILFSSNGNAYLGGFTLNAGTVIVGGVNAMGGGTGNTLTINGGTIAANATRDLSGKYTGGITIGGDFTLGGVTTGVTSGNAAVASNLTFSDATNLGGTTRTITIGGTGVYTFNGVISGDPGAGLIINGPSTAGSVSLGGANTFDGGVTVNRTAAFNGALLRIGNATALGTGDLTVGLNANYGTAYASGGGAFLFVSPTTAFAFDNNIVLPNAPSTRYYTLGKAAATSSTGTNLTVNGVISGGGPSTILQLDSATGSDNTTNFTLTATNTFAGQIRLNRGYLNLANASALGTASLFLQTNPNATAGNLNFSGFTTLTNNVIIGATTAQWINTAAATITFSGVLSSATSASGGFSKMGTGTLNLTAANTYNGSATAIANGTLSISGTGRLNSAAYTGTLALTLATSIFDYSSSTNQALSGVISGSGMITKSGSSTLTLGGAAANTFSGGISISGGTVLAITTGSALGTGDVTVNAGAAYGTGYVSGGKPFLGTSTSGLTINNNIAMPATAGYYALQITAGAGGTVNWGGVVSGGGNGVVLQLDTPNPGDSTSVITLSGINTLALGTTIRLNRGRLTLTNTSAAGQADLFLQTNGNATSGNLNFSGFTTLANNVIIGTTVNQWINTAAANITLSGVLGSGTSGSGGFSKMGTGTLTLTGANTYNGSATTIADGTLSVSGTGRLNSTAYTGTLVLTAATSIFDYSSLANQTMSGVISGNGSITKSGDSTLTLGVANSYTGTTTINAGKLEIGATNALPATGVTISGGTLSTGAAEGFAQTSGQLKVTGSGSTINFGTGSHTLTFASFDATDFTSLTITGWTGTDNASGTGGKLVFTDPAGLTPEVLAGINFTGYGLGAVVIAGNEVVPAAPVPEPVMIFGIAAAGLGLARFAARRRMPRFRSVQ